jgi:hypothetical protein
MKNELISINKVIINNLAITIGFMHLKTSDSLTVRSSRGENLNADSLYIKPEQEYNFNIADIYEV